MRSPSELAAIRNAAQVAAFAEGQSFLLFCVRNQSALHVLVVQCAHMHLILEDGLFLARTENP